MDVSIRGLREQIKIIDKPAFGIWKDHKETNDVLGYVNKLRQGRKLGLSIPMF